MRELSGGVAGWQEVCYPGVRSFPREIVKRVVEIPGWGDVPALPSEQRLEQACGPRGREQDHTPEVRARLSDYPVESYEARAAWQALVAYGERVVSLESEVEGEYLMVDVVVAR